MGETQTFGKIWIYFYFRIVNNSSTGKSEVDKTIYIYTENIIFKILRFD